MEVAIRTPYHMIFISQDTFLMLPKFKYQRGRVTISREAMCLAR